MSNLKKVLIITYYWPPAGGPGVQRVLKFAKYLPEFGWEPIILTVKNGEYPAIDNSLNDEIPQSIKVFKTKAIEPFSIYKKLTVDKKNQPIPVGVLAQSGGSLKQKAANFIRLNVIIPDAKIGWKFFAVKEGQKIIDLKKPDLLFSSSPPPTTHLIAKTLAERNKIKWIADLRDPWSKIHYYKNNRLKTAHKIDERLESKTLSAADKVITVSENFSKLIAVNKDKIKIIPNGFDNEDITDLDNRLKDSSVFQLTYVGGLNENRFYPQFFEQLAVFAQQKNFTKQKIKLTFVGSISQNIMDKMHAILGNDTITIDFKGYLEHKEALKIMFESDLLLLFTEKVSHYSGHIPGKLFEYISTGNFILGIGDKSGDANQILKEIEGGIIVDQNHNFIELLNELHLKWLSGNLKGSDSQKIEKFSRKNLTKQLTEIFNKV